MNTSKGILGVDVGGVIIDFIPYGSDSPLSFSGDNYLQTPEIPGAIESLQKLNEGRFSGNIFLVSRFGPQGPERVQKWLKNKDFQNITGIPKDHLYQCAERHEKRPIVEKLGITHFVDDRAEILADLVGLVPHRYLFQELDENGEEFADVLSRVTFVKTWRELLDILR
jgi:hypothetical protein